MRNQAARHGVAVTEAGPRVDAGCGVKGDAKAPATAYIPGTMNFMAKQPTASAKRFEAGNGTLTGTVRQLWPYIWPHDRFDLKLRVALAVLLMIASKVLNLGIAFAVGWATNALVASSNTAAVPYAGWLGGAAGLTALYAGLRISTSLVSQAQNALFAAVAMNAVRRLAIEVFGHLHRLSLRFHLERKTGGLTRVLERGRNAIETIVRTSMLTAVPTALELVLAMWAFQHKFDWRYVAILAVTIVIYLVYTTIATNWRINIRRSMNESDTDANTKAIDSLLNFETVKYFGAEAREVGALRQIDGAL